MVILGLISLIVIILIIGAPVKTLRFMGNFGVKLIIGVLFLFFLNVFGGMIGLHIPINIFTVLVSSVLGLFGISSLVAIQLLFF